MTDPNAPAALENRVTEPAPARQARRHLYRQVWSAGSGHPARPSAVWGKKRGVCPRLGHPAPMTRTCPEDPNGPDELLPEIPASWPQTQVSRSTIRIREREKMGRAVGARKERASAHACTAIVRPARCNPRLERSQRLAWVLLWWNRRCASSGTGTPAP